MFRDLLISKQSAKGWSSLGYKTNGLVAAYDGQFNAGDALHDGTATTWVDVSGNGNDMDLTGHSVTWGSDCLVCSDTAGVSTSPSRLSVTDTMKYSTVEIVFVATTGTSGAGDAAAGIWNTSRDASSGYIGNDGSGNLQYRYQPTGTSNTIAKINNLNTQNKAYFCGRVYSNGQAVYNLINPGASIESGSFASGTATATPSNEPGGIYILGDAHTSWWFGGTIWAIRIYNRALTATERVANAQIDVNRFGL